MRYLLILLIGLLGCGVEDVGYDNDSYDDADDSVVVNDNDQDNDQDNDIHEDNDSESNGNTTNE